MPVGMLPIGMPPSQGISNLSAGNPFQGMPGMIIPPNPPFSGMVSNLPTGVSMPTPSQDMMKMFMQPLGKQNADNN